MKALRVHGGGELFESMLPRDGGAAADAVIDDADESTPVLPGREYMTGSQK